MRKVQFLKLKFSDRDDAADGACGSTISSEWSIESTSHVPSPFSRSVR